MTGWLGVVEDVCAVIGLFWVAMLALLIVAMILARPIKLAVRAPQQHGPLTHALNIADQRRQTVAAVDWDAVRAEVNTLTPADFDKPGGTK